MSAIPIETPRQPGQSPIGLAVLIVWLALMCLLFWWFQYRFTSNWVTFDGRLLSNVSNVSTEAGERTVVHFVDNNCPCTKFSLPLIQDLESRWRQKNVSFRALHPGSIDQLSVDLQGTIPASPAVALWDSKGKLTYFGPYSSGAICGEGEDLLGKVLAQKGEGQWTSQEAVGCFCPWPSQT